jgi:hypothetical protein
MVEILKKYRSKINASPDVNANANKNIIILEISYENDLSKP